MNAAYLISGIRKPF